MEIVRNGAGLRASGSSIFHVAFFQTLWVPSALEGFSSIMFGCKIGPLALPVCSDLGGVRGTPKSVKFWPWARIANPKENVPPKVTLGHLRNLFASFYDVLFPSYRVGLMLFGGCEKWPEREKKKKKYTISPTDLFCNHHLTSINEASPIYRRQ